MKKQAPEKFPSELKKLHFPELSEDEEPTRLQLKEKILELHEGGREEEASILLDWNERLKRKPPESSFSKASKVTLFVLIVLAGILGALWLLFGGVGSKSDSLVICVVGGQTLQGDECFSENPGGLIKGSKPEPPKPGGDPIIPGDV